ncbi:trypsin inhibitor-like [Ostrinia furnacalis]|uniref:trypsin inhibitor-like n=1 Tax=Ostrinia furnacalis TaxID=93504 RepID=UPI00103A44F8|nr:trypsin inhibitor-like [Ostrinia furnacalis]
MNRLYFIIFVFALIASVMALDSRCFEPIVTGPCRASQTKYAFTGRGCDTFVYGGCQGSGNNFDTIEECVKACA